MTDAVLDLRRSDAELSALAERRDGVGDDPVLDLLAAWAADIDAQPLAEAPAVDGTAGADGERPVLHHGRTVAVLTLAITLSSSGIAAAVNGDPLAPITFVVTRLSTLGQGESPTLEGTGINRGVLDPTAPVDAGRSSRDKGAGGEGRSSAGALAPASAHDAQQSISAQRRPATSSGAQHRRPQPVIDVPDGRRRAWPQQPGGGGDPAPPSPEPAPGPGPHAPMPSPPIEPSTEPPPPQKPGSDPPTSPE